ncbi:MAG: hypothetical protein AAFP22_01220 [Planctomycetota bacterium]
MRFVPVLAAALVLMVPASAQVLGEPRASFDAPADARVGDLVTYAVEVDSVRGAALVETPDFGYALEVVESAAASTPATLGEARTDRFEWTLRVLAGGTLVGPDVALDVRGAAGSGSATVPGATLELPAALQEGEDEPRPLPPFPEPADRAVGDPGLSLLLGALALVLPFALWFAVRARRRGPRAEPAPNEPRPEERLAQLVPDADPAAAIGALPPLVRAIVDAHRGAEADAATDEEWADAVAADASLAPDARAGLAALVREASAVRYGGGAPTVFAARDAKARAEDLVQRIAGGAA